MYFKENDVIELIDKSYLVDKVSMHNDIVYYKVNLYEKDQDNILGEPVVIKAVFDTELYISEINDQSLINSIKFN